MHSHVAETLSNQPTNNNNECPVPGNCPPQCHRSPRDGDARAKPGRVSYRCCPRVAGSGSTVLVKPIYGQTVGVNRAVTAGGIWVCVTEVASRDTETDRYGRRYRHTNRHCRPTKTDTDTQTDRQTDR